MRASVVIRSAYSPTLGANELRRYTGLFSIEANANLTNSPNSPDMGADPYANVQKIYDVLLQAL
jgi:hypothetical protein